MKLLRCKVCSGEMDIIGNEHQIIQTVKCKKCGFSNEATEKKETEVIIIKRRS